MTPSPTSASPFPTRTWQAARNQPFAQRVQLDQGHSAAPTLQDWDWLEVDDGLAEVGVVKKSTASALPTTIDVTLASRGSRGAEVLMGGWGDGGPRKGG